MEKIKIILKKIFSLAIAIVASTTLNNRDDWFFRILAATVLVVAFFNLFDKKSWQALFSKDEK